MGPGEPLLGDAAHRRHAWPRREDLLEGALADANDGAPLAERDRLLEMRADSILSVGDAPEGYRLAADEGGPTRRQMGHAGNQLRLAAMMRPAVLRWRRCPDVRGQAHSGRDGSS